MSDKNESRDDCSVFAQNLNHKNVSTMKELLIINENSSNTAVNLAFGTDNYDHFDSPEKATT